MVNITQSDLQKKANEIRKSVIKMIGAAGSGHPGGSLSIADILAVLYFKEMKYKAEDPAWPYRDRFVLSKGHGCPALYAALAQAGFFPVERLMSLRKLGSILQGHPDMRRTPGVEISTGSLGLGFSAAVGMALAAKMDKKEHRIYCIVGDGECQEGIVWESAQFASHHNLDNLILFVDNNGLQIDGPCNEVCGVDPLGERWRSFGWHVIDTDGHDTAKITQSLEEAKKVKGKPVVIIAKTVKGKGVSFMENEVDWHGVAPSEEQVEKALRELG